MPSYYISHSSIPGRQNGVRHGPPYPIPGSIRAAMAARSKQINEKKTATKKSPTRKTEKKVTRTFSIFGRTKDISPKSSTSVSSTSQSRPKTEQEIYLDNIRRLKNTPLDQMSDDELRMLTNRLGLEAALKMKQNELNQYIVQKGKDNKEKLTYKYKQEVTNRLSKTAATITINFGKNLLKQAFNWDDSMFVDSDKSDKPKTVTANDDTPKKKNKGGSKSLGLAVYNGSI